MNKIEQLIKSEIVEILKVKFNYDITADNPLLVIEIPKSCSLGDYSTSVAMRLAKELKQNPRIIAEAIKIGLDNSSLPLKKVEIAGPGFINLFVRESALADCINHIISEGAKYGYNQSGQSEKILVEYVSANPTGDLHVGHAKAAAWGDSLTRLLKMSGYDCIREYYINDAGNQIDNLAASIYARYCEAFGLTVEFPEDGYHAVDIIDLAKKVKEEDGDKWLSAKSDARHEYFRKTGIRMELDKIKAILHEFGVTFDVWSSEQTIRDSHKVEETFDALLEKGYAYETDGAVWLKTTEFGDDKDRVIKKQNGAYTYLMPDIAYHLTKLERGYTHLVDILGADHHGYISRMKAALMCFGYPANCLDIDILQMVRLIENGEEVKMSKRTGKAVTLRELIDDIGVDALRYFFCSRAADTHLDFDLTLAKSQTSDNPVFYAQYAHARICSILRSAPEFTKQDCYELLNHEKEVDLLKHISEFTNDVSTAAKTRSPNKICNYIQKLAQMFHAFYGACKVVDASNPALTNERVGLLIATKTVLENALNIIGVTAPEQM